MNSVPQKFRDQVVGFVNLKLFVKTRVSAFENAKPGFRVWVFLHDLTTSVRASEYGPQCPFNWVEVRCIACIVCML